ncbi:hypothetical protein GCM10023116_30310 [Kistimonas scapharcae]|uniref:HEAT repeat domain-containing protein n=1 Tax=Kistimonas scapharcae TaxID=1036133 RepID=A0ABP8V3D4_9GAMM
MNWLIIWYLALALAAISLGMMATEICLRLYWRKKEIRRDKRKKALTEWITTYIFSPLSGDTRALIQTNEDIWIIAELAEDFFRSLKGNVIEKLGHLLENQHYYQQHLTALWRTREIHKRMLSLQTLSHYSGFEDEDLFRLMISPREHPSLQLRAMRRLAERHILYLPPVLYCLKRMKSVSWIRAADVLRHFDPICADDMIPIALNREESLTFRLAVIHALQEMHDVRDMDRLLILLDDPNDTIREHLLLAVRSTGIKISNEWLQKALTDASIKVRRVAVRLAEHHATPALFETLYRSLEDPDWSVGYHAAHALFNTNMAGRRLLEMAIRKDVGRAADIARDVMLEMQSKQ